MTESCTFVIFGATGNLAQVKLLPALYHLEQANRLPEGMAILGFGRRNWSKEEWCKQVEGMLEPRVRGGIDQTVFKRLSQRLHFSQGDLSEVESFQQLRETIENSPELPKNIAFYMAISPAEYKATARNLATAGLNEEKGGWRRLVVEKPFGYDLESAQILDSCLHRHFSEQQIYRIDHYLGKAMVQNVLVFRFANLMLEPLWNRNYIDHVQITHSESLGIAGRAHYYDGAGALRDMVQSHLLQMLALVAMEPPAYLDAESLRDEKVKALKSIRPIPRNAVNAHAYRAQYRRGTVNGKEVPGYLEEEGIAANSTTETYASLKLYIDNWRWRGVPFYLRTGKRMAQNSSVIAIRFKNPPQQLFRKTSIEKLEPNWILLSIQPHECLRIEMQVKEPGLEIRAHTTQLDASYCGLSRYQIDAYEALLLDVMEGDQSLFLRYDEIRTAWKVVDPIIQSWSTERDFIHTYPAGTWGPNDCQRIFDNDDHYWRNSFSSDTEEYKKNE